MVIIYTVAGVAGFAASSSVGHFLPFLPWPLGAGSFTVGASASIFGLLGSLVYYGRRTGSRHVHAQAVSWALPNFILGLMIPGIDNWAHAGGFVGGYLAARALDPLKQEQISHIAIAVLCLAAAVVSIIVSLLLPASHYS
jgi:rhomboid protease GluP